MFGLNFGPTFKQFVIVIVANLSLFQVGMTVSWSSPILVKISDESQTVLTRALTEDEGTWVASTNVLVGVFVIPFTGFLANYFGRKRTMIVLYLPRIASGLMLVFATEYWMLILARCIAGLSDMLHISVTATYSSEIASKENRGALGTASQILSALGMMIILTIGPYVSFQSLNIIYSCLVIGTFFPVLFVPESPYYLYFQGQKEQSVEVLTYLRGSEENAQKEILEYSTEEQFEIVIKELCTDVVAWKTIAKVMVLAICPQIIGYNMISFYLQTIFDSTHTNITSEISSLIMGCLQLFACLCTILLTDRLGRKPILAITMAGMAVGMAGLGTFFKLTEGGKEITGFLNYLPLVSIAIVIFSFNAGLGSTLWILIAEQFDSRFRAIGVSIGAFTFALSTFLSVKYFGTMTLALGPATLYYIFCGFCVFTGLFVKFFFNETKGKAFSQIQIEMGRERSA